MLSPGELQEMRETVRSVLPSSAIIQTATRIPDGQGGVGFSYLPVATVLARLATDIFGRSRGDSETNVAGRTAEVTDHILTLPHDTTIDADDRVVYRSVVYEVKEVLSWEPWELARRVRVVEVD
jgi:Phage head-tail joining protein